MRISTAISQMKKIREKVKEWANADTAYYDTSLKQFGELRDICAEVTDILGNIGHVQRYSGSNAADSTVNARLDAMENKLDMLCNLLMNQSPEADKTEAVNITVNTSDAEADDATDDTSAETNEEADEKELMADVKVPNAVDEETDLVISFSKSANTEQVKKYAKIATKEYYRVLGNLAKFPHKYKELKELSQLLFDWYSKRFYNNYRYHCQFKYSHTYIRKLLYLIVVAYGHHMANNTLEEFVSGFYDFLDLIGKDDKITNQCAVPFEIYSLYKNYDHSYDNAEAIVMYDQLYDDVLCYLGYTYGDADLITKYQLRDGAVDEIIYRNYSDDIKAEYRKFEKDYSLFMIEV